MSGEWILYCMTVNYYFYITIRDVTLIEIFGNMLYIDWWTLDKFSKKKNVNGL